MTSRTRAITAATAALSATALLLAGCSSSARETQPTAVESIRTQFDALEHRIGQIVWSMPTPSSLWYQLDPMNDVGQDSLTATLSPATPAPYPFRHEVGEDLLTIDVIASALTRSGGLFEDAPHAYACVTYVVDPYRQDVTRTATDCPPGATRTDGAIVALDQLGLDPIS